MLIVLIIMHVHVSSLHFIPGKDPPVSIEQEGVWHPELIWMFQRGEKPFAPSGIQAPDSPSCSFDTILTMVLRLLLYIAICPLWVYSVILQGSVCQIWLVNIRHKYMHPRYWQAGSTGWCVLPICKVTRLYNPLPADVENMVSSE